MHVLMQHSLAEQVALAAVKPTGEEISPAPLPGQEGHLNGTVLLAIAITIVAFVDEETTRQCTNVQT